MNSKSKLAKKIQSQNDALEFQQSSNVLEDLVDSIESMDISEEVNPKTSSKYLFFKCLLDWIYNLKIRILKLLQSI